jgi:DNA-binding MarR family transcriptional regulator
VIDLHQIAWRAGEGGMGEARRGRAAGTTGAGGGKATPGGFRLTGYMPYRLAVLAEQVSLAVAASYATRFRITRQEWRVLAALGSGGATAATDLGRTVTLDKMQVSRAIAGLEQAGLVLRRADHDRRRKLVALTPAGRRLYARIVPLALQQERDLLRELGAADRAALDRIVATVTAAAQRIHGGQARAAPRRNRGG